MNYRTTRLIITFFALLATTWQVAASTRSNLVCFVQFANEDTTCWQYDKAYYDALFNGEGDSSSSVYNYFKVASYGELEWKSYYTTGNDSEQIIYQDNYDRGYYQPYSSINPIGYSEDALGAQKLAREQELVKNIMTYLEGELDDTVILDADNNGIVDNVTLVLSNKSDIASDHLLWPHRSTLYIHNGSLKGKKVSEYILLFERSNGYGAGLKDQPITAGLLAHEMSHTLGTIDLYHAGSDNLNPIGGWDLMSDQQDVPQQMSAYTKWRYTKWIENIPEISKAGVYTLNPLGGDSKEQVAYKIKPIGSDEYFIVEYRKDLAPFEAGLPSHGLLVYRVNDKFSGNYQYDGIDKFDELYLFRPNGSTTADGDLANAAFSQESGRTAFGGDAAQKPFYSNGDEAPFALTEISSCGGTLTFRLEPQPLQIYITTDTLYLSNIVDATTTTYVEANTAWSVQGDCYWLQIEEHQEVEQPSFTVTTTSANLSSAPRTATLRVVSSEDSSVMRQIVVVQNVALMYPPTHLEASLSSNAVNLSWKAPITGSPIYETGFEVATEVSEWSIINTGSVGWNQEKSAKYTLPYTGAYSMRMSSTMVDEHQDEWIISPTISSATTLSFYSKSIAPGKNNAHNFYEVLVSSDNGETWQLGYDLKLESNVVNKYENIIVDLSEYTSEKMKVAFRAYDDNNIGLSYWWHIDDVQLFSHNDAVTSIQYNIYRNEQLIATTHNCTYTDHEAENGAVSTYYVEAVTNIGVTPHSVSVEVDATASGVQSAEYQCDTQVFVDHDLLRITATTPVTHVTLYSLQGTVCCVSNSSILSLAAIDRGMYIVEVITEGNIRSIHKILY